MVGSGSALEFFCGKGRISALAAKAGFAVASCDIELGKPQKNRKRSQEKQKMFPNRPPLDMNGEVGFAFLGAVSHMGTPIDSKKSIIV